MSEKENQRIALTKRLLREGLLTLLEMQPMEKISVTELCKISGINRSTFYNHYSSPQDILYDMENKLTRDMIDITARHKPNVATVDCVEEVCTYLQKHKQLLNVLIVFNTDTDLVDVFRRIETHFASSRPQNRRDSDPDTIHLTSSFICTGCYYMIREWLIRDIPKTPREIAELVMRFASQNYS